MAFNPRAVEPSRYENDEPGTGVSGSAGGVLTGTYPDPSLVPTAVVPGSYTNINVTVDADGRITTVTSAPGTEVLYSETLLNTAQLAAVSNVTSVPVSPVPSPGTYIHVITGMLEYHFNVANISRGAASYLLYGHGNNPLSRPLLSSDIPAGSADAFAKIVNWDYPSTVMPKTLNEAIYMTAYGSLTAWVPDPGAVGYCIFKLWYRELTF